MKTSAFRIALSLTALSMAGSAFAQDAPVRIDTAGLPTNVAARLQAKAQEGSTALIQYVNRTRMLGYQVRVDEIVVTAAPALAARAENIKVAANDTAPAR